MITFSVFLLTFIIAVLFIARSSRRHAGAQGETERVAQDALPKIGAIAERAHSVRFGRPPTNLPHTIGKRGVHDSWYPPTKKAAKR